MKSMGSHRGALMAFVCGAVLWSTPCEAQSVLVGAGASRALGFCARALGGISDVGPVAEVQVGVGGAAVGLGLERLHEAGGFFGDDMVIGYGGTVQYLYSWSDQIKRHSLNRQFYAPNGHNLAISAVAEWLVVWLRAGVVVPLGSDEGLLGEVSIGIEYCLSR